jgi:hypothetical protein
MIYRRALKYREKEIPDRIPRLLKPALRMAGRVGPYESPRPLTPVSGRRPA